MSMNNGFYAIDLFGRLYCVGNNDDGLIGLGAGAVNTLTEIPSSVAFAQVASENAVDGEATSHRIALTTEGKIYTWGNNTNGCLGNGTFTGTVSTPTEVSSDTDWTDVFSGNNRQYAIKAGGALYACGNDDNHALGIGGATSNKSTLTLTGITSGAVHVIGTASGTAVLKSDGTIWVVGKNLFGMFGTGDAVDTVYSVFTQVGTDSDWTAVGYNKQCCLAIKSDLTLWGAGLQDTTYPLPDGMAAGSHVAMTLFDSTGNYPMTSIFGRTAWNGFRYLISTDTRAYCFGNSFTSGEHFGYGSTQTSPWQYLGWSSSGAVDSNDDFDYVSCLHDCEQRVFGIKSDKTIWVWGYAPTGLGAGTNTSNVPTQETSGLSNWKTISNQPRGEISAFGEILGSDISLSIGVNATLSDDLGRVITGSVTLPRLVASGLLSTGIQGSMELPVFVATGNVDSPLVMLGSSTLPALKAAGVLSHMYGVDGSVIIPRLKTNGVISVGNNAVVDINIPILKVAGIVYSSHGVAGDINLPCLVVHASVLASSTEDILEFSNECNLSA